MYTHKGKENLFRKMSETDSGSWDGNRKREKKKSEADCSKKKKDINRLREWWIIMLVFLEDLVGRFCKSQDKPSRSGASTRHKEQAKKLWSVWNRRSGSDSDYKSCSRNEVCGCVVMDVLENWGQYFSLISFRNPLSGRENLGMEHQWVIHSFTIYFWGAPEQGT